MYKRGFSLLTSGLFWVGSELSGGHVRLEMIKGQLTNNAGSLNRVYFEA